MLVIEVSGVRKSTEDVHILKEEHVVVCSLEVCLLSQAA